MPSLWDPYRNASDALPFDDWEIYERDKIRPTDDWSSLLLPLVFPDGTFDRGYKRPEDLPPHIGCILVTDMGKDNPVPKIAGGRKRPGETPRRTALREGHEEMGLLLPNRAIRYWDGDYLRNHRTPHWNILYRGHIEKREVPWINSGHPGNEGEVPHYYTNEQVADLRRNRRFLQMHDRRLVDLKHFEPLG